MQLGFSLQNESPVAYDDSALDQIKVSEEELEKYTEDEAFNYTEVLVEENAFDRFMRWLRNVLRKFWEAIFGVGTASGFLYVVFRILPYILLGVLIFLLIRFFVKVNSNQLVGKSRGIGSISLTEEEEIIQNEDIPALIKKAVKQQNYRLAIRYYYLLSLKHLTDNNIISWQPQKTNADYINEFTSADLKIAFKHITRIYDYVWYGEFHIDITKYEALKSPFEALNSGIKNQ